MIERSDAVELTNNSINCSSERNCSNCAKARVTGYNHQNQPLYTCPKRRDRISCNDCDEHQSYEERYGCNF